MTRRLCRAPVAVTSDGRLLLNALELGQDGVDVVTSGWQGAVFVGIVLSAAGGQKLRADLGRLLPNVTGPCGVRLRRRLKASKAS